MTTYFNTRATRRSQPFIPTKRIIFEWRICHFSDRASFKFKSRRTRAERERQHHKRSGPCWRWRMGMDIRRGK
jgi:hypothetical protein